MADQEENLIGQQFGNYRLVSLLGEGGFADVYLGEHVHLKTQAAIKILRTRLTSEDREKFLTEARTIAHLEHPNIVKVWDYGIENGLPYLVMTRAANGTLRQLYPKGTRVKPTEIIPYVKQVADALHYAHAQRLVHRDVKPENMLLGKNQEVLLSDFGIALVAQSSRYQSTQDVVGTVAYMAPEQLQGKPSPASDQYALAIVVYEWLCGERPFQGSFLEIFGQHISVAPPSLCARNPAISPVVEQAIFVALAKDPQQRFGNIKAFANALSNALAEPDAPTVVKPLSPATPLPAAPVATPVPSEADPNAPTFINTQPPVPDPTPQPGLASVAANASTFIDTQPPVPHAEENIPTFINTPPQPISAPGFPPSSSPGNGAPPFMPVGGQMTPVPPPGSSAPNFLPYQPAMVGQSNPSDPTGPQAGTYGRPLEGRSQAKRPKSALSTLVKVLSLILVIVIVAVGAFVGFSILRKNNNGGPSAQNTPNLTATQNANATAATNAANASATATAEATPITGADGTPTTTSNSGFTTPLATTSPTLPLTIMCVSCNYPDLTIQLQSISANAANSSTLWSFTIANKGASQCSNIDFNTLQLEDENGTQYQSGGQANDSWSLNAGTSTTESPTFALLPRASMVYTLDITLDADCTSGGNVYQTENLQFVANSLTGNGTDPSVTTLTPKSPTLPLAIACVQCNYPKLTLTLNDVTANTSGSTTELHFTIVDGGASACNDISFETFQLEDPNGTQYQTSGQANNSWALNANTQVVASPTLAFVPQAGVTYTLNVTLDASCADGSNVYQTENIRF